jgi:hypothetical protein
VAAQFELHTALIAGTLIAGGRPVFSDWRSEPLVVNVLLSLSPTLGAAGSLRYE